MPGNSNDLKLYLMFLEAVLTLCFLLFNCLVSRLRDPGHKNCRNPHAALISKSIGGPYRRDLAPVPGAVCSSVTMLQGQVVQISFQQDLSLCF